MTKICDKIIEYSFYALFLFVPLAFTEKTSELFEMNKMWLTWGLTIIIAMSWFIKMILEKKIILQRTPLDIPIGLFLFSQIISTIFSLDPHTSLWGYYSRFNGGLLSIISYILLYYAYLSNFKENATAMVKRSLFLSLVCGLIVALWGLPSHFGYDPTCYIFRHTFDVSCWTAAFMPKIRIFSTLGQPDWLAAYLAILIPISLVYAILKMKLSASWRIKNWKLWTYLLLTALFYLDLLYTRAKSGFVAIWISLIFFTLSLVLIYKKQLRNLLLSKKIKSGFFILVFLFIIITFFTGSSISLVDKFTLNELKETFAKKQVTTEIKSATKSETKPAISSGEFGGTDSGKIRLLVWEGAINVWKSNPLIGTGVETFAFAYYKYKPAGQNLTSEWNYLYNKAHNEYLNYLATTGIVGLSTYLGMIVAFFVLCIKYYVLSIKKGIYDTDCILFITGLLTSYISILITNFFGFSVVITNIYLFLIPAFAFILVKQTETKTTQAQVNKAVRIDTETSVWQWTPIFFILIIGIFMLFSLVRYWQADVTYALGSNYDQANEYQQAYPNLQKAVQIRGSEPVFKDELSINDAIIATAYVSQKYEDEKTKEQAFNKASALAQEAINTSNEIVSQHPNNAVFWKTRVRLFYTLSQVDPDRYLPRALDAIEKASLLAPNDANIWYNRGVLYGQNKNLEKGISAMEKTVALKSNYRDAHYALGLFYHTAALDKDGKVADENYNSKAIAQMKYILEHLSPTDADAQKSLENWTK
jgi:putative inorganic carbon (hco3(-)) transporter